MSQRLAHEAVGTRMIGGHPLEWWKTPIGHLPNGKPIYPVGGASPDDPSNDEGGTGGSGDGGDKGGSEGQGGNGDTGTGEGANGNKSGETTVSKEEYDKVLERMKAADRNSAAALAKLKELEEKDLSEQEKIAKRLPELETQVKQLSEENKGLKAKVAFLGLDGFSWHDPDVALAQVDLSEVITEDGSIDKKALKKSAETLAKEKTFLVKSSAGGEGAGGKEGQQGQGGTGSGSGGQGSSGQGVGSGGKGGQNGALDEAALRKKYPALNL